MTESIEKDPIVLNQQVQSALRRKVEEHNEKYGDTASKRATYRMLAASMKRGIGAYKTNPGGVRPGVTSPEQWAYGRVNGLLHALRNGRFKRKPYDRDLLPKEHRLSSKREKQQEDGDLYDTPNEAEERAAEIGCVGYHVHEVDGTIKFMPCDQMSDYEKLVGMEHQSSEDLTLVDVDKAEWSTAFVNDLPDSAFFYVGAGGEKDDDGKTVPRTLRKLPYRGPDGNIDLPHLRNALSRLSQTDIPQSARDEIRARARRLLDEQTKRAALAKAYEDIDFSPPKGVSEAAELGLALRREHSRGGTLIGVARARDLAAGKRMSPETIRRMVSFFARHEGNLQAPQNRDRTDPGYPGAGRIAWLLWGGDPGHRWAKKVRDQMVREDASKALKSESTDYGSLQQASSDWVKLNAFKGQVYKSVSVFLTPIVNGDRVVISNIGGSTPAGFKHHLPSESAIEVVVKDGQMIATDVLVVNGVDLREESYRLRKEIVDSLFDGTDLVSTSIEINTAEDLVITTRQLVDDGHNAVQIIDPVTKYGDPVSTLSLEEHKRDIWNFVPPRLNTNPKLVFVSGSPNAIESIRGIPLAGPDGATFKSAYLDRFNLSINDVCVFHATPCVKDSSEDWNHWLHSNLGSFGNVPIVALGKAASAALGETPHTVMPHPRAIRIKGDRGEVARKAKQIVKSLEANKTTSHICPIIKADDEKRLVFGVVLEPHTVDLQGDVLDLDTIEKAAYNYLVSSRVVGDGHSQQAKAEVVESYLAPADMELGGQSISKGSWVMVVHVSDDELWSAVKSGDYTGFSIGGTGARKEF